MNGDGVMRSTSVPVSETEVESCLIGCSGMPQCLKLLSYHISASMDQAECSLVLVTLGGYMSVLIWLLF